MTKQQSNGLASQLPSLVFIALGYFLILHYGDAVTQSDLLFPVGFLAYIFIANIVCFDSNKLYHAKLEKNNIEFEPMGKHSLGKGVFITETSFLVYFGVAKVTSFLAPLVLIFAGPSEIASSVTPSILQVIGQAVAEPATATIHDVPKILVPFVLQAHRFFGPCLVWALDSWIKYNTNNNTGGGEDNHWYTFNLLLAWANLVFTAWNLFVFLPLRVLPLYFDKEDSPTVEFAYTLLPLPKKNKISSKKQHTM